MLPRRHLQILRLREPILALLLILAVTGACWPRTKVQPITWFDQTFYIGIAYDLIHHGRFTNGYGFESEPQGVRRPPGMRFTPLYPALLAVLARHDPPFSRAIDCVVHSRGKDMFCPRTAASPRLLQFLMLIAFYLLVWGIARAVTASRRIGWIALGLALLTAPELLEYVNYVMTEITALTLATAATYAAVRGLAEPRSARWLALAGALAGLAALTRPAFFYLFLVSAAVGFVLTALRRPRAAALGRWAAFTLAGIVVVLPWIIRNALVLHDPHLTAGYGPEVLVQRLAFDQMSWAEYRLSFLCWLPDGNGIGSLLFGPGACHRFQWSDQPDNFYAIGNGPLMSQALTAAGGWPHMLAYLLHTYVFPHPFKFAMVTISLALRGAWIDHYWGLILMPLCLWLTCRAFRRCDIPALAVTLPAWFMLLFTAALSVNQARYNLMLIPPFALSGAIVIEVALRRVARPQPDAAQEDSPAHLSAAP
jgi:4-amino-4-deoxy-L-arabinose transferase-like glycosyltransferase